MKLKKVYLLFALVILLFSSCENSKKEISKNEKEFISTLEKHLNAVNNKDFEKLKSTLSPEGDFLLILPNSEPSRTSKEFLDMHKEWFQDSSWTFETEILYTNISENMGVALVEIMYKEPKRNGRPYFNKMAVSYTLKKVYGTWCVVTDHASTIEKTSP